MGHSSYQPKLALLIIGKAGSQSLARSIAVLKEGAACLRHETLRYPQTALHGSMARGKWKSIIHLTLFRVASVLLEGIVSQVKGYQQIVH